MARGQRKALHPGSSAVAAVVQPAVPTQVSASFQGPGSTALGSPPSSLALKPRFLVLSLLPLEGVGLQAGGSRKILAALAVGREAETLRTFSLIASGDLCRLPSCVALEPCWTRPPFIPETQHLGSDTASSLQPSPQHSDSFCFSSRLPV